MMKMIDDCILPVQSINRAFVNGSVSEHVVDFDLESPESVVVDWVAHNLYWVDSGTRRVEMSHVDGSSRRVIVWQNVQPRTLVVDPTHGFVFFCFCYLTVSLLIARTGLFSSAKKKSCK